MKSNCLLLFIILFMFSAQAEENLRLADIRALSMGNNGVMNSVFSNPALIDLSTYKVAHLEYFNRYGVKELSSINGSFQYPNSFLSAGIHLASFGFDQYRQNMARLMLSKRLGKHWIIGLSFQYSWLQSELYEEVPNRLSTDIGIVYYPFDKLLIGVLVKDVPSVRISSKDLNIKELKTYKVQTGFNWEVINNLLITSFVGINEYHRVDAGFGMEYKVWNCFFMRGGIQLEPFIPSLGAGLNLKGWSLDAVALWHPILGVSSGVGLSYSF